jgi:hypothetical protein
MPGVSAAWSAITRRVVSVECIRERTGRWARVGAAMKGAPHALLAVALHPLAEGAA